MAPIIECYSATVVSVSLGQLLEATEKHTTGHVADHIFSRRKILNGLIGLADKFASLAKIIFLKERRGHGWNLFVYWDRYDGLYLTCVIFNNSFEALC